MKKFPSLFGFTFSAFHVVVVGKIPLNPMLSIFRLDNPDGNYLEMESLVLNQTMELIEKNFAYAMTFSSLLSYYSIHHYHHLSPSNIIVKKYCFLLLRSTTIVVEMVADISFLLRLISRLQSTFCYQL